MIGKIISGGLMVAALVMAAITGAGLSKATKVSKLPSTIRLHDMQGRFFCSAVVVSARHAITAAHCVVEQNFFQTSLSKEAIRVFAENSTDTHILAFARSASTRADVAIISGDFSNFEHAEIETDANKVYDAFTSKVTACGFAWGGNKSCFTVSSLGKYYFFYTSNDGSLYPGMSGGPIFNSDGKVIGVNSAVSETQNIYAPIVNIEAMLDERL